VNPTTLVRPYEGKEPSPSGAAPTWVPTWCSGTCDLQGRLSPSRPNACKTRYSWCRVGFLAGPDPTGPAAEGRAPRARGRLRPSPVAESNGGSAPPHSSKVGEALAFRADCSRAGRARRHGRDRALGERAKGSMPPSGIAHRQLTPDPVWETECRRRRLGKRCLSRAATRREPTRSGTPEHAFSRWQIAASASVRACRPIW